jgi:hypothetical protein
MRNEPNIRTLEQVAGMLGSETSPWRHVYERLSLTEIATFLRQGQILASLSNDGNSIRDVSNYFLGTVHDDVMYISGHVEEGRRMLYLFERLTQINMNRIIATVRVNSESNKTIPGYRTRRNISVYGLNSHWRPVLTFHGSDREGTELLDVTGCFVTSPLRPQYAEIIRYEKFP